MPLLFCDIETRGELDLPSVGSYKYLAHESTQVILFAYAYGDDEVKIWECLESPMPEELKQGLSDDLQLLVCHNSSFERIAFRNHFSFDVPVSRFQDTAIFSRYLSMPGSLEKVGKILDIQNKKLTEFFVKNQSMVSMFCSPLQMGGELTLFGVEQTSYRYKDTHPKEWNKFRDYASMDVEAMREIYHRMSKFPLPDFEYELYELDQRINDYGVYTDSVLLQGATLIVEKEQESLRKEFKELTGIQNPRSTPQTLAYVKQHGYTFPSIGKSFVNRALAGECNLDEVGKKALLLRKQISKSSVAKLESCKNSVESDGRVRGLFNFMGAARTGRWTSGLFQAHNLIKATKEVEEKYDLALGLLRSGDYKGIRDNFSSPIDVACSALRPILRAPSGSRLIIADLAAIESRGAGWVAGCDTLMQIFREDKDPYCFFASLMDPSRTYEDFYHEYKILKKKKNRNDAKPPFLGCGYGLGAGEIIHDEDGNLVKTGLLKYASDMGIELTKEYAEKAVMVYRNRFSEVCDFWYDLQRAFISVVTRDTVSEVGPLRLDKEGRVLRLWLPSGRALHYINPEVTWSKKVSKRTGREYDAPTIWIDGIDQKTHQWTRIETRGTKVFENVVQGLCRDILGVAMLEADKIGFKLVLHCHDEIAAEVPYDSHLGLQHLIDIMRKDLPWAPGFLVDAAGFETEYYKKD